MAKQIAYREAKVYFDGNHYIAIPKTSRKIHYKARKMDEKIECNQENKGSASQKIAESFPASKKEVFERVYREHIDLPKRAKKQELVKEIHTYFENKAQAREYVE